MTISIYPPYGSQTNPSWVTFDGTNTDAFGRLRVSNPYTLFDAQSRFSATPLFSYVTATGGTTSYNSNASSVNLNVTTTSGSTAVAQTKRVFQYQPGKSLLIYMTFTMSAAKTNLQQRIGYFGAENGVYFEQGANGLSFVIRTYTSGTVSNTRFVAQADWNGDKLDGTGASGITLDITKTQILWFDIEWLGVGNVRCGFIINGQYIICHTFQNANQSTSTTVYMQTAILPLRYEISNTGATASNSTMQMICSTVISEGGYDEFSQSYIARPTGTGVSIGTSFVPIVSIRANSSYFGSITIPSNYEFLPTASGNYEVVMVRNATLGNATWATTMVNGQVDVDTAANTVSFTTDNVVASTFTSATNQASAPITQLTGYNFGLQLGYEASLSGNGFASSDTMTLAARTFTGTNSGTGSICFWNLTN